MRFVAWPEAGKFHPHQIRDRCQQYAVLSHDGFRETRDGLDILRTHFLSGENQVHSTWGARRRGVHEHVYFRHMPILEPDLPHRRRDTRDVGSVDCEVHILREPGGQRVAGAHVKQHCQAAHDSILDLCRLQRATNPFGDIGELLQVTIVCLK